MSEDYNSVTKIGIANKVWYPDMGTCALTVYNDI